MMALLDVHEIRLLFVQEAEARLSSLGQLILALETSGPDDSLIDSIFRELHTIKGSSAVARLPEVSSLAHRLEGLVEDLRSGRTSTTPDLIDALFAGVDDLADVISQSTYQPGVVGTGDTPPLVEPARQETALVPAGIGTPAGWPDTSQAPAPPGLSKASPTLRSNPTGSVTQNRSTSTSNGAGFVMVPLERLEELSRLVSESASAHLRVGRMVSDRFATDPASIAEFNDLSRSLNDLQDRAMRTQMVAVATITDALHRTVRDLAHAQEKDIRWETRGTETELDRGVLHRLSDSLLHLVRNAVDHGIETPAEREAVGKPPQATIRLHAMQLGSEVIIAITDDGRGVDREGVRHEASRQGVGTEGLSDEDLVALVLRSGLSTKSFVTDISGRGVGLDVVRANVEAVRGRIEVRSQPGRGAEFRIIVPITLAVLRCLLVEAGGSRYALPFHRVVRSQADDASGRAHAEGRPVVWVDRSAVPVSLLAETLGGSSDEVSTGPIVVLSDSTRQHAFKVDQLLGQRDVVLKGLSAALPKIPAVAGASVEPDGSVLLVLDPPGLIQRAQQSGPIPSEPSVQVRPETARPRILVVDDALTVRELQRGILERAGFSVRVASDGSQAMALLLEEPSDLILTDIEMPEMDGFALTKAVRADPDLGNIPVLILSSRADEADRQRGLDVGADGYIVKSGFDEGHLLTAVTRLLGGRR
ncbi:MAG: two-component system, chemotaxis family, sensor kinase CheA [Nocardioidaceae bacterium]|jgi:two-component system chemotaxis sensor kinase CheA|nr:two-component system, chemotaxis family, sensor kinase CheA [Nocardioidaceae bacterium]